MARKADVKILTGSRGGGKTAQGKAELFAAARKATDDYVRGTSINGRRVKPGVVLAMFPRKIGEKCPHDYMNWLLCPVCRLKTR